MKACAECGNNYEPGPGNWKKCRPCVNTSRRFEYTNNPEYRAKHKARMAKYLATEKGAAMKLRVDREAARAYYQRNKERLCAEERAARAAKKGFAAA